jgi:hypothetical protein
MNKVLHRLRGALQVLIHGDSRRDRRLQIPNITKAEVEEIKHFFPRDKFFIFGHARSGTTLLMRLIRLHPEVHCNYQAHFFTRRPLLKSLVEAPEVGEWLTRKSNRWNHGRDLSPVVLRAVSDFMLEREAMRERKRIVGDKSPSSTIHGQAVRDLFSIYPDASLIYIVRDGRDVLISERFRNFVEESRYLGAEDKRILAGMRSEPQAFRSGERSIFTESMIRRVASGWARNVSETDLEGKRLFGRRYRALRYEDLLRTPSEELRRLWGFLRTQKSRKALERVIRQEMRSNPDEEWQTRRNGDMSSFLLKGQVGNWRQLFTARDRRLFKEVAGQQLIAWGYEKTMDW